MNGLQDLIAKLQKIEEADAPPAAPAAATDPRAQYDQFKSDDAKKAAIETVKKYMAKPINQIGRLENLIDPKTGIIYYGAAGMDATKGTPTKMPMRFMSQGDQKTMMDAITAAGLKVVDSGGYAMIDPKSLATLGQAPAAAPAAVTGSDQKPATATPAGNPEVQKKIDRVKAILGIATVAPSNATVNTTTGPNLSPAVGAAQASSNTVKESIVFKSRIGRLIAEEFGILEAPDAAAQAIAKSASNTVAPGARAELDALWSELTGGVQSGIITGPQVTEIDALQSKVTEFQVANPHPQAQPATSTTPTTPSQDKSKSKIGSKNAGTTAYQNWLNANGVKVAVDGKYGPETQGAYKQLQAMKPKEFGSGGPRWQEMSDMMGVGTAYNVIQGQGLSLNSPQYLELMKKYGFDPKTGNSTSAASSANPTAARPAAAVGSDQKAAPTSTGNPNLDVLNTVQDPKQGQEHWVNGSRFIYRSAGFNPQTGQPNPGNGWYKNLDPSDKLIGSSGKFPNQTMSKAKYTGPDADDSAKEQWLAANKPAPVPVQPGGARAGGPMATPVKSESVGFADDELNRLVSLVHHR